MCISDAGLIPNLRFNDDDELLFVAAALNSAGVLACEVSVTFPGSLQLISHLAESLPNLTVGAGNVTDARLGQRCLESGAAFLSSDGYVPDLATLARENGVVMISGALTPGEIIAAWQAGSDFVRVFPCDAMGGPSYIASLKGALPQVRLIAAGGVDQQSAAGFMKAGATALSVGRELIPRDAVQMRQAGRIQELVRRYFTSIDSVRY